MSDLAGRVAGPARLGFSYTAGEIRQRAALIRELRAKLAPKQYDVVLAKIPKGYAEGFLAKDEQYRRERHRVAGQHPRRLRMLDRAERLPFSEFEDMIYQTATTVFRRELPEVAVGRGTFAIDHQDEHEALVDLAAETMRLMRLLLLLSLADRRRYPAVVLLILLWLLTEVAIATRAACWVVATSQPVRVTRPPGRVVVAGPRVARAPGRNGPSLSMAARAEAGCARIRGNAVIP
jgi:hypothetical protein